LTEPLTLLKGLNQKQLFCTQWHADRKHCSRDGEGVWSARANVERVLVLVNDLLLIAIYSYGATELDSTVPVQKRMLVIGLAVDVLTNLALSWFPLASFDSN